MRGITVASTQYSVLRAHETQLRAHQCASGLKGDLQKCVQVVLVNVVIPFAV